MTTPNETSHHGCCGGHAEKNDLGLKDVHATDAGAQCNCESGHCQCGHHMTCDCAGSECGCKEGQGHGHCAEHGHEHHHEKGECECEPHEVKEKAGCGCGHAH